MSKKKVLPKNDLSKNDNFVDDKDPKSQGQLRIKLFKELNEICRLKMGSTLPLDSQLMSITRKWEIDLFSLDDLLSKKFPTYDNKKCLLDGVECSMRIAVKKLLGDRACELVTILK